MEVLECPQSSSWSREGGDSIVRPKAMTVRMDPEQAAELEAVAEVEGVPVAEAIRNAISEHIESRRQDEEFQSRLRASLERNRQILEKLAR
jgi:predicted DNA-binding protein